MKRDFSIRELVRNHARFFHYIHARHLGVKAKPFKFVRDVDVDLGAEIRKDRL